MPSRPANGARMVFLSIVALSAATLAWACWNAAVAESRSAGALLPWARRSRARSRLILARTAPASALASVASSVENVLLHEQIAGLHLRARLERNLGDDPVELGADHHALHGAEAADRMQRRLPGQLPGFGGGDARWLRLLRRQHFLHHVASKKFVAQDASDKEDHREQHEDHSLGHT